MSVVYSNIDLFAYDQEVYQKDGDTITLVAKIPLSNLGAFLAKYCNENNIDEVHLNGYTNFTVDIKNQIVDANKRKFKNNKMINVILTEKGKK